MPALPDLFHVLFHATCKAMNNEQQCYVFRKGHRTVGLPYREGCVLVVLLADTVLQLLI